MTACPKPLGYEQRTVEHVFGTLKAWMGSTHFRTRTLPRVRTELSLQVLAYNPAASDQGPWHRDADLRDESVGPKRQSRGRACDCNSPAACSLVGRRSLQPLAKAVCTQPQSVPVACTVTLFDREWPTAVDVRSRIKLC